MSKGEQYTILVMYEVEVGTVCFNGQSRRQYSDTGRRGDLSGNARKHDKYIKQEKRTLNIRTNLN